MTRAFEKAYNAVRDGVIAGRFAPSRRITEQEVAEVAGVSRTPVREALRRLHAEGVVDFRPNQGAMVTAWSDDDLDEIFELRSMLESHAARRAAQRATTEQIAALRALAEQRTDSPAGPTNRGLRLCDPNDEFHRALQAAAGSTRLTHALSAVLEAPLSLKASDCITSEDVLRAQGHHLEIVRALEVRDGEWAASVMRSHIQSARRRTRP